MTHPDKPTPAEETKLVRHKIGCTRTIQTAVLVCAYLKDRYAAPQSQIHRDSIRYVFTEPTNRNATTTI
jgi:hypothetical protein